MGRWALWVAKGWVVARVAVDGWRAGGGGFG